MQAREIVKSVLDELVAERRQVTPVSMQQLCKRIGDALRLMRSAWTQNHDGLAYDDPWRRLAFVCAHMAPNADNLQWLIYWMYSRLGTYALDLLNQNNELRVCAIGGGPGTELLAFCKYLTRVSDAITSPTPRLKFLSVDSEAGWEPVLQLTAAKIREWLAGSPETAHITVDTSFRQASSTFDNTLDDQTFDFYLINYVVSELRTDVDRAQFISFMKPIVAAAPETAVFVALDMYLKGNGIPKLTRDILAATGIRMIRNDYQQIRLPPEESPYVLEPYTNGLLEFGNWNLRQTSAVYWYVGTKHIDPHPALEAEVV